jgi:hypothetical protein
MQTTPSAQKRNAAASRLFEAPTTATPQGDRLLTFRQVAALTGSACKTGHHARELARRGQIRVVRINERTLRYSEQSVLALVAGRVDPAARGQVTPAAPVDALAAELAAIDARDDLNDVARHLLRRDARERAAAANPKGGPSA